MKRRMAFLMSVALTANMFSMTPVYAADEFTDTEISAPEVSTGDDEVWSDGSEVAQSGEEFLLHHSRLHHRLLKPLEQKSLCL